MLLGGGLGVQPMVAQVIRSPHVRADLHDVLHKWSLGDLTAAMRIVDFYDELERIQNEEIEAQRRRK